MKKNNFQLSTLNSQLILLLLILVTGCDFSRSELSQTDTELSGKINTIEKFIQDSICSEDFKMRISYIDRLDSLADRLSKPDEKAVAWLNAGRFYRNESCYEISERVLLKAQKETESMKGDKRAEMKADILLLRGQNCIDMSDFVTATQLLTEAGTYYEEKKEYEKLVKVYNAQVVAYQAQLVFTAQTGRAEITERENYFLNEIEKLSSRIESPVAQADCLSALVNHAINEKDYEKAKTYLSKLDSISQLHNYSQGIITFYGSSGFVEEKLGNTMDGIKLYYKSYETALEAKNMAVAAKGLANAAFSAGKIGEYGLMRQYSLEGVKLAEEYDIKSQLWRFLDNLSTLAENTDKDYKQALDYRNRCINVYIELYSKDNANLINQYTARFESFQKENKITALEQEKRFVIWLGIAGGFVLILTLTVFFSLWRWAIQKRRVAEQQQQLAEQHIKQLEQEKQLVATQAVLDGETRERARLARDLHDGLGSMLTGAKLSFLEMKKDVTLGYADVDRFDKALGLLDRSVHEMRRVAHHLMPDSLSRFGLKPAVSDFCNNLPSVSFTYYGDESRLDPNLEVMIYRSIHELVNNALKHAGADTIMVQIMQEPCRIAFTVQDDGCGFDPSAGTQGVGLQNIRTRIASYNGILNIDSKAGEGTEINVELKVEN